MISPFAYIGPGAGFAFLGSFLTVVLSVVAGLASALLWPLRMAWLTLRRKPNSGRALAKRAIFLGLDGLDPKLTEKYMSEGKMPHLARLKEQGGYRRLRTTFPALSPVAWSTFATGVNPARHNIFDFLNRDLRTYAPELSSSKVRADQNGRATVEMRRKSEPFWKILGQHDVSSTILRVPISFPPDEFNGRMLSAMATPDLRGSQGTYSLFTSDAEEGFSGSLTGPDGSGPIPFRVADGWLEIQGARLRLAEREYTPWIRLRFTLDTGQKVRGIARFLLTGSRLYVTPVEIDPENPALPISHPAYYATYLAKLLGSFATLGMAEDTWALNDGAIDEDAFLEQARAIQAEREAMFFSSLAHTRRGVVACVFDTSDRVQHMFYRYLDPLTRSTVSGGHEGVIEELYRDMDRLVGKTMAQADPSTALFVLSDHGFCSFHRGINLNSWLRREGYLVLKGDPGEYFQGVDWDRTQAYTFGLGGLYLNLQGREALGIVTPGEAERLKSEFIARLSGLRDEDTGDVAIRELYAASALYSGPYLGAAPDLIVGYAEGYRASWEAATGTVGTRVFEDNTKAWSGDHCVDPHLVPGVLFTNRKLAASDPGIEDMAPTALHLFGIEPPPWMEGKSVLA